MTSDEATIERAVLAMMAERNAGYGPVTQVRAVIKAMREPTEAMVCAGDEKIIEALHDVTGVLRNPTPAHQSWQAMVDAALDA